MERRVPPIGNPDVLASVVVEDAVPVNAIVVIPAFSPRVKLFANPGPCKISLIRMIPFPVEIPEISDDPAEVSVYTEVLPSNLFERLSKR
tara:strand:+ start:2290 stop:2559 length:270 start_codon:yes stop_codon:yes gene_type:complete